MKNKFKFLGIIALIAVIGLTMTACPSPGGGGPGGGSGNPGKTSSIYVSYDYDGNEYKLEIGEDPSIARAAYTPKVGHYYKLTKTAVDGTEEKSTGTIADIGDDYIIIAHSGKDSTKIKVGLSEDKAYMISFDKDIPIDTGGVIRKPHDLGTYTLNKDGKGYTLNKGIIKDDGSAHIPDTFRGLPITSIGIQAFYNCTNLKSVTIPSSVTSIGESAFGSCTSLESVTIPSSVTSIGEAAFGSCTSLESLTIPSSVKSIDNRAFGSCTSLESVTIQQGVTSISEHMFSGCTSLKSVTIPSSVKSIDNGAFAGCTSLESVTIQQGVTSIGEFAFIHCTSLKSVTIPSSVTSIGLYTFSNTNLESVTIPSSVTSIGNSAFTSCKNLTNVSFDTGSSITSANFGSEVFPEGVNGYGGDTLRTAYLAASPKSGTYTRTANGNIWTK